MHYPLQVAFSKRYLNSEAFEKAKKIGKPAMTEFGTRAYSDPTKGLLARAISTLVSFICFRMI